MQGREGWRDFKRPRGSGSWGQRACLSLCSKEKEESSKKFCFTFLSPQIKRKTLHWGLLDSPFCLVCLGRMEEETDKR